MSFLLDSLHEELKGIYLPNTAPAKDEQWNQADKRVTVNAKKEGLENSIVTDVFGGVTRSEFHVEGARGHSVNFDRFFVLSLSIPADRCSIEDCVNKFFQPNRVEGYQLKGKTVRAQTKTSFERLPNVLVINLKRFVYTDKLIKKREHVFFEPVLTIEDSMVSPHL